MPAAGFSFIEQYRNLTKELEDQNCEEMMSFDQEVPQSRFLPEDVDIKSDPDTEVEDISYFIMDSILNHGADTTITTSSNNNINNSGRFTQDIKPNRSTPVMHAHSPAPSSSVSSTHFLSPPSSSSPSPMLSSSPSSLSSSLSSSPSFSSSLPLPTRPTYTRTNSLSRKTSTYVTELGGSGGTVVSTTTDFLGDSPICAPPSMDIQEDCLDYIDLDKQSISFYDDLEGLGGLEKVPSSVLDEQVPLEDAVILMRDVIRQDCDALRVPYDPLTWSSQQVMKWVSWVCYKNSVPDVSHQFALLDGRCLCSITANTFAAQWPESGVSISNELELWKAANSCFPELAFPSTTTTTNNTNVLYQLETPYLDTQQHHVTPSVSPAPSTTSSTSTISTHSDHSDDEGIYNPPTKPTTTSTKPGRASYPRPTARSSSGRGHKQTIHLWQFLRELLLSQQENHSDCIRWLDRAAGIFKIEDSKKVASLWGARKNRPAMNYDKLSRSVRQYYKKGIIKKTDQSKRLVYQFCAGYL